MAPLPIRITEVDRDGSEPATAGGLSCRRPKICLLYKSWPLSTAAPSSSVGAKMSRKASKKRGEIPALALVELANSYLADPEPPQPPITRMRGGFALSHRQSIAVASPDRADHAMWFSGQLSCHDQESMRHT